jgi:hypothetical protein
MEFEKHHIKFMDHEYSLTNVSKAIPVTGHGGL